MQQIPYSFELKVFVSQGALFCVLRRFPFEEGPAHMFTAPAASMLDAACDALGCRLAWVALASSGPYLAPAEPIVASHEPNAHILKGKQIRIACNNCIVVTRQIKVLGQHSLNFCSQSEIFFVSSHRSFCRKGLTFTLAHFTI